MKILIFGNGFLGNRCKQVWGDEAELSTVHVSCAQDALAEIQRVQPDAVLNAAGVVGKPNVDWCDSHPLETMIGNTALPIMLAEACAEVGVYLLHMGSGCIFYGDSPHADKAWREDDFANPLPAYTRSKYSADLVLSTLPNVGIARIRMPIDSVPFRGNLIDKVVSYPKVSDVENSVTIVEDMIDVFYQLMDKKAPGIFHVVNPGAMRHRQLIALYEEIVDPTHTNEWISNDDLVKLGLTSKGRSNNIMASTRLVEFGIAMRPVLDALTDTMQKYALSSKKSN